MRDELTEQLRTEAANATPAFDTDLHARALSAVRSQRAMESRDDAPARSWLFLAPFAAAACVAGAVMAIAWFAQSPHALPIADVPVDPLPKMSAPDARLVAAVPHALSDIESELTDIGDDAQRLGTFFAERLKSLGGAVPSGG